MERETEEMMKDSEELLKESEEFENLLQEFKKQSICIDLIKCILSRLSLSEKVAVGRAMSCRLVAGDKVTVKSIEVAMILWSVTREVEDFERVKKMIVEGKMELNERYPVKAHGKTLNLSPLHTAVYLQSPQLVELLMTSDGVDVGLEFKNPEDSDDFGNVLDLAVSLEMNQDLIQSILENDEDRKLVNNNETIEDLLCYASDSSKVEFVELLFGYEAAHPVLNPLGFLVVALKLDNLDMFIKILPRATPRLNTIIPLPCCSCSSPTVTLLHLAICMKNLKVVKLLLQAGSDVNSTEDLSEGQLGGSTPLMQAIVSARHRGYCSKENCQDRVIAELLSAENIDLDIQVGEKTSKKTALDLVRHDTCPGIKKMVEQAYARHNLRKKLMKRKEDQAKEDQAKEDPAKSDQDKGLVKSDNSAQAKGPPKSDNAKSAQAKADPPISTQAKSPATSDQDKGRAKSAQAKADPPISTQAKSPATSDQDKSPAKSAQAKADPPISTQAKSPATSDQDKGAAKSDQVEAEADLVKGDQVELSKHGREKICWKCGSPPSFNKLYRCAGCKVAWYCKGDCQAEDWDRHSGWCVLMERRRKERKEKKEKDCQED
eukprot:GFUD01114429.1.p1 GENE.GFUD01114429.1~~GFUD01114429.1.p1  ORF type:complete len:630 (+),score=161.79 GFUD01114429.1:83-1891(+)